MVFDQSSSSYREVPFDLPLLDRYKKALDTAVKIATTYNVTPIHGSSIVFVNISSEMSLSCSSGKGLGAPRQVNTIWVLYVIPSFPYL